MQGKCFRNHSPSNNRTECEPEYPVGKFNKIFKWIKKEFKGNKNILYKRKLINKNVSSK